MALKRLKAGKVKPEERRFSDTSRVCVNQRRVRVKDVRGWIERESFSTGPKFCEQRKRSQKKRKAR